MTEEHREHVKDESLPEDAKTPERQQESDQGSLKSTHEGTSPVTKKDSSKEDEKG